MLIEYIDTGNSLKMSDCTTNINERVNYTANIGNAFINTANTSYTSGTAGVLSTASTVGTLVKKITIKGTGNTTRGMIRFFVGNGETFNLLIEEIDVAAVVQVATTQTFNISYDVDWSFGPNLFISVSTNNADGFVITVEALDLTYP